MMKNVKTQNGFTLLEIMIALFIFAIIATLVAISLHNVINNSDEEQRQLKRLSDLQTALIIMKRDIEQMIDRPIVDTSGSLQNAVVGNNNQISFTRTGNLISNTRFKASSLSRVDYQMNHHTLYRLTHLRLDPFRNDKTSQRSLLSNVKEFHIRYLDRNGYWVTRWPSTQDANQHLPQAIEVTINLTNWGQLKQIIMVGGHDVATQ